MSLFDDENDRDIFISALVNAHGKISEDCITFLNSLDPVFLAFREACKPILNLAKLFPSADFRFYYHRPRYRKSKSERIHIRRRKQMERRSQR